MTTSQIIRNVVEFCAPRQNFLLVGILHVLPINRLVFVLQNKFVGLRLLLLPTEIDCLFLLRIELFDVLVLLTVPSNLAEVSRSPTLLLQDAVIHRHFLEILFSGLLMTSKVQEKVLLLLTHISNDLLKFLQSKLFFAALIKVFVLLVDPFVQYLVKCFRVRLPDSAKLLRVDVLAHPLFEDLLDGFSCCEVQVRHLVYW